MPEAGPGQHGQGSDRWDQGDCPKGRHCGGESDSGEEVRPGTKDRDYGIRSRTFLLLAGGMAVIHVSEDIGMAFLGRYTPVPWWSLILIVIAVSILMSQYAVRMMRNNHKVRE